MASNKYITIMVFCAYTEAAGVIMHCLLHIILHMLYWTIYVNITILYGRIYIIGANGGIV